jgi:hypothetical protein
MNNNHNDLQKCDLFLQNLEIDGKPLSTAMLVTSSKTIFQKQV